jgi:CRISPR-associated protein Cmr4
MYKKAEPFFIMVETPLHAGSGTDLGIVDMPIQRERHTGFPKIESSGLKGCIREVFEELKTKDNKVNSSKLKDKFSDLEEKWEIKKNGRKEIKTKDGKELIKFDEAISLAFGPEGGDDHAGALGFTDARILLFPVKSMKGVFAWVTCPMVLEKFQNDLELAGIKPEDIQNIPNEKTCPSNCQLFIKDKDNKVVLEEYTFEITKENNENEACSKFATWLSSKVIPLGNEYKYWRDKIKKDIVVLSDDDFGDFVNLSTEVITRIKINNETGTVQPGALFTEEYLPTETILYSLALTTPIFNKNKGIFTKNGAKEEEELVMEYFTRGLPEVIQVGGNATIGKGIVRTIVWGNGNDK